MKNFNKLSGLLHYYLDSLRSTSVAVKIERFDIDQYQSIIVIYRLGRQKLLNKLPIREFEPKYFDKVSSYDQHRLTKFSTFQSCLDLYGSDSKCKDRLVTHIMNEVKNEQLF